MTNIDVSAFIKGKLSELVENGFGFGEQIVNSAVIDIFNKTEFVRYANGEMSASISDERDSEFAIANSDWVLINLTDAEDSVSLVKNFIIENIIVPTGTSLSKTINVIDFEYLIESVELTADVWNNYVKKHGERAHFKLYLKKIVNKERQLILDARFSIGASKHYASIVIPGLKMTTGYIKNVSNFDLNQIVDKVKGLVSNVGVPVIDAITLDNSDFSIYRIVANTSCHGTIGSASDFYAAYVKLLTNNRHIFSDSKITIPKWDSLDNYSQTAIGLIVNVVSASITLRVIERVKNSEHG